jgi:hypothetical protein
MRKLLNALAVVVTSASSLLADNPIIKNIFTADPSAHLYEGKVFIYPSHDQDKPDWFNMVDYHVFSSTNLVDWTDHGVALHVKDVPWAKEYMWAPDCAYKDGTYFFYFPARDKAGDFRIGVATSTSPAGPFKPEPKPIEGSFSIDPAVFIDEDGAAYMYFGGLGEHGKAESPMVARMKDNMKEFAEEPRRMDEQDQRHLLPVLFHRQHEQGLQAECHCLRDIGLALRSLQIPWGLPEVGRHLDEPPLDPQNQWRLVFVLPQRRPEGWGKEQPQRVS